MSIVSSIRHFLLDVSVPITKWIGHVHAPFTHKRMALRHFCALKECLIPGDVLMSRTDGELTNVFIPGFWSHGAVYVGDSQVVEVTGEGISNPPVPLMYFVLTKDYVRACRPLFANRDQMQAAADWCRAQAAALPRVPYDYDFASGNRALYCFELSYVAYQAATGNKSPWQLRETLGVQTVIGDDFDKAIDKWETIYDSRKT